MRILILFVFFSISLIFCTAPKKNKKFLSLQPSLILLNPYSIDAIKAKLESFKQNKSTDLSCQKLYCDSLTNALVKRIDLSFANYQPDSILAIIQWSEKFKYLAEIDTDHQIFFMAVHSFWMNYISNNLGDYLHKNNALKSDPTFLYLVNRCAESNYIVSLENSNTEKIIDYLNEGKYSYIFDRFYYGTSLAFKLILFALTLLTLSSYYITFNTLKAKISNK